VDKQLTAETLRTQRKDQIMPHDRNGKLVEVGDIVKGRGYNINHDIIGPVLGVTETESCNLTVGTVALKKLHPAVGQTGRIVQHFIPRSAYMPESRHFYVLVPGEEYGATKDFEIIQKADGTDPV
jgi:hypothetical protein